LKPPGGWGSVVEVGAVAEPFDMGIVLDRGLLSCGEEGAVRDELLNLIGVSRLYVLSPSVASG
jgi:hypothetical protein